MLKNLVITLISEDHPGIVESISSVIASHGGNWLESQLAHLAGKFAGVVRVQVETVNHDALKQQLESMANIHIQVFEDTGETRGKSSGKLLKFIASGPDRPGIVHEISSALAEYQINLEKLDTRVSSMPYSGEPLFEAEGKMLAPSELEPGELAERFDAVANTLAMDISLVETD